MTQNMVFSVSVSKVLACEQLSQILTFFLIDVLHSVTIVLKSGYTLRFLLKLGKIGSEYFVNMLAFSTECTNSQSSWHKVSL